MGSPITEVILLKEFLQKSICITVYLNSTEKPQQQALNTQEDLCPYFDKGNYIMGTPQKKGDKSLYTG